MANKYPSKKLLDECFDYNPDTGNLTWKIRPLNHFKNKNGYKIWNSQHSGNDAGSIISTRGGKKYKKTSVGKVHYYNHRLAVIMSGIEISEEQEVDHINGDGTDNRICNLRVVTTKENSLNKVRLSNNTSGVTGVCFLQREKKWRARINKGGKEYTLGVFSDINKAIEARKKAEVDLGFHKNHGNERVR